VWDVPFTGVSARGIDRYMSGVWDGVIYILTLQGGYPCSYDSRRGLDVSHPVV
jgi:hypothetical protein